MADSFIAEKTFPTYIDEVVIPSFSIASDDHRRGVLGREQMNELKATVAEFVELVKENRDIDREQQPDRSIDPQRGEANVLALAGRGFLDLAVADLLADILRSDLVF